MNSLQFCGTSFEFSQQNCMHHQGTTAYGLPLLCTIHACQLYMYNMSSLMLLSSILACFLLTGQLLHTFRVFIRTSLIFS